MTDSLISALVAAIVIATGVSAWTVRQLFAWMGRIDRELRLHAVGLAVMKVTLENMQAANSRHATRTDH